MRRLRVLAPIGIAVLSAAAAQSQRPSPEPAFAVASVRQNPNDDVREAIALEPDGSVRFTAFPVRTLITIAYRSEGLQRFDQLVGAPSWMATDRFDIVARTDGPAQPAPPDRVPLMVRALLRDRFGLRAHTET